MTTRGDDVRTQRLAEFVQWVADHIEGDEKGEAQIFLDHLFRAFGQPGLKDVGAVCEQRIRKDSGGTAFADCVWKPHVLIEMKKRGEDLTRHYRQAFDYWTRLVPGRPRYVVLCNFDQFWVYDFETQMDEPKDRVRLEDLPQRYGPLAFLFPTQEEPTFGNDHEAVTRDAADRLALLFNKLVARNVDRELAQRFVLQSLVALFAEDIGLLQQYTLEKLLDECKRPEDAYDLIGGLFEQMNNPDPATGGRFRGVDYFNGGIFQQPARIELHEDEVNQLRAAANDDWSRVRPEIFGTIFEHSMDAEQRHAFGAHFTSPADIMKIVGPTIVEPWREMIRRTKTVGGLEALHHRMQNYRVLDPACGSGNFLYIAYRELKRLEAELFERLAEVSKSKQATRREQMRFGFVTARQFFGLDINPFAVELAKVTMMIARKLAIDELHVDEQALPLDNLDGNFKAADALIDELGNPAPWPAADVIIGNPPFLGAKRLKPERGPDYVNAVRKAYPDVPGMADYCVYWFRKAHDHLRDCTPDDPLAGRAGLVGTQNVRNNKSREGGLDHICASGTVVEAVDNQPWSGEANVHVSIANWVKHVPGPLPDGRGSSDSETSRAREEAVRSAPAELLIPDRKKLWFKIDPPKAAKRKRGQGSAAKDYELDVRECEEISAALSDEHAVSHAHALECNRVPQVVFNGQYPRHAGFKLEPREAKAMLASDARNSDVLHPYFVGRVMLTHGAPQQWVIDFQRRDVIEAKSYVDPFSRVEATVLPHIEKLAAKEKKRTGKDTGQDQNWLRTWWQHFRCRTEMLDAIGDRKRYIACAEVTKRPIFCFISSDIRADKTMEVFAFDDDYSFGILQSDLHWLWFITKCSKLKSDFRYTPQSVFDTYPWPQSPSDAEVLAVAEAGREVRRVRGEALEKINGGLRAVYRTHELPGRSPLKDAHAALDAAVLKAYGFSAKKDLLKQLLDLNLAVADRIDRDLPVTAPGVPPTYPDPDSLVTDDCIRPE